MDLTATISALLLLLPGLCNAHQGNDLSADGETPAVQSANEDISAVILKMNNGSRDFLLEGDLVIQRTRTAMRCRNIAYSCLWPKSANGKVEVPYYISRKYNSRERSAIIQAMKGFERQTCIRFVPRRYERAYLSLQSRYGCSSLLGRIGDRQKVSLNRAGCIDNGIIQHELMHALGFYHEHTRSDRDHYVRIKWENVRDYYLNNFKRQDTENLNIPYDYNSLMHYGRTAFGPYGAETIIPFPDPSVPIGQRRGLSRIDILRINKLYKC